MKKRFILVIIALIISSISFVRAGENNLDEVVLEVLEETPQAVSVTENIPEIQPEKTLKEKLHDIYHLEVEKYDTPNFLLEEVLTKHFDENSIMEKTQLWAGYNGDVGIHFSDKGDVTNHYDFNTLNVGYDGFLKNNNADFRIMFNYNPFVERNFVQNLFADMYIATNKIPHHRILIGNSRPPVGVEGAAGPFVLPFLARAQISRNFGTVRKLGARVSGNYSLADYDFGVYSSDTYFQEFFPGAEFIGWVNLKPLGKTDGRYGKLKMGGGLDAGHRDNNFCVTSAYIGWEYKRFMANFEWAHASGYNGPAGFSSNKHASGFYTTVGYMLTKKLQLIARYDEYDPNREIAHNNSREYTVGLNYFMKGQGLKFILNYVFCQNDSARDSHRVMLGTQVLL